MMPACVGACSWPEGSTRLAINKKLVAASVRPPAAAGLRAALGWPRMACIPRAAHGLYAHYRLRIFTMRHDSLNSART